MNEKNRQSRLFPYQTVAGMILAAFAITPMVLSYRFVQVAGVVVSGASFIVPLTFIFSDVLAEVYGYRIAKTMLWTAFFCTFIFALLVTVVMYLPMEPHWQYKADYSYLFGHLMRVYFSGLLGIVVGGLANIYMLSKWRLLLKGRYFWLRSLGSCAVSEIIFVIIIGVFAFAQTGSAKFVINMLIASYVLKQIINVILIYPANCIVRLLKSLDSQAGDDFEFNPFK